METLVSDLAIYVANEIKSYCLNLENYFFESRVELLEKMIVKGMTPLSEWNRYHYFKTSQFIIHNDDILPMDYDLISKEKPDAL